MFEGSARRVMFLPSHAVYGGGHRASVSVLATGLARAFYPVLHVASVVNRTMWFLSRLVFAQLARGPPVIV